MKPLVRLQAALAVLVLAAGASAAEPLRIGVPAAREAFASGRAVLIDIREPDEHALGVAPGARLLPLSQLATRAGEIPKGADQPVLLICRTQNRSGKLAEALRQQGYSNVSFVDGGMKEWQERGFPMVAPAAIAR